MREPAPNRVRSTRSGRATPEVRAGSAVTKDTINELIGLMDKIQEYVIEIRRMVTELTAGGFSEDTSFKVDELVRLRKMNGPIGIVRVITNADGWVGVEWPHLVTEWVRSDELERA